RTAAAQAASSSPPGPTRPGPARKNSPGRPLPAAPPQPQIAHPAGEPKETEESRFMPLRMRDSRPHAKTKLPFLGSVVVLPFANLSGDPAQDYFADGVTENLTTDLSRIRDSFVIARNTAFTYRGKAIDAKAIGKELGVRYVLEGSVQRDRKRVRTFGLTASRRTWRICSSCRTKLWRSWPTPCDTSSAWPKRQRRPARK